jgi:hypothetical protein
MKQYFTGFFTGACLVVSAVIFMGAGDSKQFTLSKWEYKIATPYDSLFELEMNLLGKEGWELVTARRAGDTYSVQYECILKKRIVD